MDTPGLKSTYTAYLASPRLSFKHSTYFPVYDRLFAPWVGRPLTFVEVGVFNGGSLLMWRDYFGPQARIIGVDFNPEARRLEADGFEIHIGNQADPAFWRDFLAKVGPIDVSWTTAATPSSSRSSRSTASCRPWSMGDW